MSVRAITFSVNEREISPATEQFAGLQGEHRATKLYFNLENSFFAILQAMAGENQRLVYRFDAFDSIGAVQRSEPLLLTDRSLTFAVEENLSRNGGKAKVYLIISLLDESAHTEMELYGFPACLRFEATPRPIGEIGDPRESLSALEQAAQQAAERAEQQAAFAENAASAAAESEAQADTARQQTEQARFILEQGADFIFDGGTADNEISVDLVVDSEMNPQSRNPAQNKIIKQYVDGLIPSEIQDAIENIIQGMIDTAAATAKAEAIETAIEQAKDEAHPVGSYYWSSESTNPHDLFGGTWEQITNKFVFAAGGDYAVGDIGGSADMPKHQHGINIVSTATDQTGYGLTLATSFQDRVMISSDVRKIYTEYTGNENSINNMPPYIVAYCWQRTA